MVAEKYIIVQVVHRQRVIWELCKPSSWYKRIAQLIYQVDQAILSQPDSRN